MEQQFKYGVYNNLYYLRKAPKINIEDASHLVLTAKSILDANNIQFMPVFGTLLGIVRQGNFIPHDTDVDMAIWEKDREKLVDLIPEFEKAGLRFACCWEPIIYTFEYGTVTCDFYILSAAPKPYTKWMICLHEHLVPKKYFNGTQKIDFLGTLFDVPANPERLLRYGYGRKWMIPSNRKGNFDSNWLVHIRIQKFYHRCIRYIKRHILHTMK